MAVMFTYIAIGIFILSFALIVFEVFDKSLIALAGSLAMIVFGILTPEEAINSIMFETILLLLAMMLIVNIASKSGIFEWLNVKIASLTRGNPVAIFLFFSIITAISSAFLDNVTTVVLIVPLTIELVRGMGRDPKPYVFAEMIFANIGGALTLIGDSSNIIIGGASGYSFLQFLQNLWMPVLMATIFTLVAFIFIFRDQLKPISKNLAELYVANIIIKRIKYKFVKRTMHKDFVIKVIAILLLTVIGFLIQTWIGLPNYIIAFIAAIILAILTRKRVDIHDSFRSVEWPTLFFFSGLFIMVAGIEKTGILASISSLIAGSSSDMFRLALIILWSTGILSMLLDNVPFVTVMVPVILGMQAQFPNVDTSIFWWALSLGACLGGNATLVGASANVVSTGIAKKHGVNITFLEHMKFSMPVTFCILVLCSFYLFIKTHYL